MGMNPPSADPPPTDDLDLSPSDQTPPRPPAPTYDQDFGPTEAEFRQWASDPANARMTKKLRNENAGYRVRARTAEQRLASLDPDGSGSVHANSRDAELRAAKIENGLLRVSSQLGVEDVDLLHAYLQTTGKIKDLDPKEGSFMDDLAVRVEETLEAKPSLRSGRSSNAPPTTGARFVPGTTPATVSRADLARMSPDEIASAHQTGALDWLLGRRG